MDDRPEIRGRIRPGGRRFHPVEPVDPRVDPRPPRLADLRLHPPEPEHDAALELAHDPQPGHTPQPDDGREPSEQAAGEPEGPWAGFADRTVRDWLELLARAQPTGERSTAAGKHRRTLVLALLRGALLDLLATGDVSRTTNAVHLGLDAFAG